MRERAVAFLLLSAFGLLLCVMVGFGPARPAAAAEARGATAYPLSAR